MPGILIYLLPAIMDMILPAVFFMASVTAAESGASASTVANFVTIWAAVYMVASLALGRVVNQRNAADLILLSCAITALLSAIFAFTTAIRTMYILTACEGVGIALFFVPFQVFMRQVGEGRQRSLNTSVGLYTFSWSIGFAAGPFITALMWRYVGWRASHTLCAIAALFVAAMTWKLKHLTAPRCEDDVNKNPWDLKPLALDRTSSLSNLESQISNLEFQVPSPKTRIPNLKSQISNPAPLPDLAWMGWVFSGLGCLAARMMFGLFPSSAMDCGLPKVDQGLTLFILSAMQACVGLALGLGRFRGWMYRPTPILVSGLFGAAGLCLFAMARTSAAFYVAAACFGVYSGTFFYYFVYHSLVHPQRSGRYIAINEATVGLTSMVGPFIGGLIADRWTLGASYHVTAGIVIAAIALQTILHVGYARRMRATPCNV